MDRRRNPSYLARILKEQEELWGDSITGNPRESGFILPDGSLLAMGAQGTRCEDHRTIAGVLRPTKKLKDKYSRTEAMIHIAKVAGLIRWMPESWSVEAYGPITREQQITLRDLHEIRPLQMEAKGRRHLCEELGYDDDPGMILEAFYGGLRRSPRCHTRSNPGKIGRHELHSPDGYTYWVMLKRAGWSGVRLTVYGREHLNREWHWQCSVYISDEEANRRVREVLALGWVLIKGEA